MADLDLTQTANPLAGIQIVVDAGQRFHVTPAGLPVCTVEMDPSLRMANAAGCEQPFSAKVAVPCLLSAGSLAPNINPVLWGSFCSIQTLDQQQTGPCSTGESGWSGTIQEILNYKILGETVKYVNVLNMDFCYGTGGGQVVFSLNKALEGGLTLDQGFLSATPGSLFGSWLTCQKEINYAPTSPWCNWPHPVLSSLLYVFLVKVLTEYSLRVSAKASPSPAASDWYAAQLRQLGYDPETRTFADPFPIPQAAAV